MATVLEMAPDRKQRGKPRAKGVALPEWFLLRVRKIADERKDTLGESLSEIGKRLAEAIGKERAWDHSAVSRFLAEEVLTAPMAAAFAELFGIPRPFYTPQSFDEALGMQQVFRRHNTRLTPEQKSRLGTVDHVAEAAEEEVRDQTPGVRSRDEVRAGAGRRVGRAARSRS